MKRYILLLLCLTIGIAYAQDTLRVRVMTYNLRFGELASLEELAAHIKAFKPDFVALQEVDSKTDRKRAPTRGKDFISNWLIIRECLDFTEKPLNILRVIMASEC